MRQARFGSFSRSGEGGEIPARRGLVNSGFRRVAPTSATSDRLAVRGGWPALLGRFFRSQRSQALAVVAL